MSNISKVILQLLRSADIINDSTSEISQHFGGENHPKLPQPEDLETGEVALNIAKDNEVISIKNSNGEIVYLPFNLAQRMLNAEANISDLSGDTEEQIAELIELLSSVSGDLETTISELSADTHDEIVRLDDLISGISGAVDSISVETYAYIDDEISSLSSHTDSELSDLHDELVTVSGNIESDLSASTHNLELEIEVQGEALSGAINAVSARTSELISNLSGETLSGLTELEEKFDTFSGNIESELHEEVNNLSETIDSLSSYTESGLQHIQSELDELPLSGLSDVTLTEINDLYTHLDKQGTYSNCYVQTKTDNFSLLLNGPWKPESNGLVFDIVECEVLEGANDYVVMPDNDYPLTAQTHNGGITEISYVDTNGQIVHTTMESITVCDSFDQQVTLTASVPSDGSVGESVSLNFGYGNLMKYIYIPEAPSDLQVLIYRGSSGSVCSKYKEHENVWTFPDGTASNFDYIALQLPISNNLSDENAEELPTGQENPGEGPSVPEPQIPDGDVSTPGEVDDTVSTPVEADDGVSSPGPSTPAGGGNDPHNTSSSTGEEIGELTVKICGDYSPTALDNITLCYESSVSEYTILTDENPLIYYEILAKSGDTWTNQIIKLASKNEYGLVKAGNNINIHDGVISINIDSQPTSGSNNAISSDAIYNLRENLIDRIDTSTDNLSGDIASMSAKVDSDIEALYEHVNTNDEALSGLIESLSSTTDTLVETVSGDLKTYIDTQDTSINNTISGLSSETRAYVSQIYEDIATVSGQIESDLSDEANRLDGRIETVSGNLMSYIDLQDGALNDKIDSLSSTTDNIIESLSSTTDNIIESLSATTDSLISGLTDNLITTSENLQTELETVSGDLKTHIDTVDGEISAKTESISGLVDSYVEQLYEHIDTIDGELSGAIDSLSSQTFSSLGDLYDQLVAVSGDIETDIANEINNVNLTIYNLSAYTVNEIESLHNELEEMPLSGLSDVVISGVNPSRDDFMVVLSKYGDNWVDRVINYASTTNYGVVKLGDYIVLRNSVITVDLPMSAITDVELRRNMVPDGSFEVLELSGDTWVNNPVPFATTKDYGIVKVGGNINVIGGVISIKIDETPTRGSENAISSDAVYELQQTINSDIDREVESLNNTISGMSGSVNTQISDLYSYVDSGLSEVYTDIYSFSSETYELVSTVSGNIESDIASLSGDLKTYIDNGDDELRNLIDSISGTTELDLERVYEYIDTNDEALNNKIEVLSGDVDTIYGILEDHSEELSAISADIVALSGADYILETRIRAEQDFRIADVRNLQNRVYALEVVVPTAATSSNTLTTVSWVNRKIGEAKTELQGKIDTLSGQVESGLTTVTNYVDSSIASLSSETFGLIDALSAYTDNELDYLNDKIDNLPLSALSDVEITDIESGYYLNKSQSHNNCYIQTKTDELNLIFKGDWAPTRTTNEWQIINYDKIVESVHAEPDINYPATAETKGGYITTLAFISTNGSRQECTMPTVDVCNIFGNEFTISVPVSNTLSGVMNDKVILDYGYGLLMKYVYIPDAPSDIEVLIINGSSPSQCSRYSRYSNVWALPANMSNFYYIGIYSPTYNGLPLDCTILGDEGASNNNIRLCYQTGIYEETVLTETDPTMQYEVLSKCGNLWTNKIIGLASKNTYGLIKAGDNINISNGVISLTLDNVPRSGSTNAIESDAVYSSIKEITTYDTLKKPVDAYLRNVHYELNVTSGSLITYYVNTTIKEGRNDQPLPVKFDTTGNTLHLYDNPTRNGGWITDYNVAGMSEIEIYNLIPGKRYFYYFDTLPTASTPLDSFKLSKTRRFLKVDSIKNVRDLGGIPTEDGGYIAYDKIFRGSELVGNKVQITPSDTTLLKNLGINYDLDLRNSSEVNGDSPLDYYKRISFIQFRDIETLTTEEKDKIKEAFETVANNVLNGVKTYIHCVYGYHRAGFLSTLIEGVLGVKQCEIDKDYELSSFSDLTSTVSRNDTNYKTGIDALNAQYSGSWKRLALECGISEQLIKDFRHAMIVEENRQSVDSEYYEVTYQELVDLRDSSKLIPGALYRMIDFDTADGVISENASCSPIPDLPDFKSAKHKFDLVLRAISKDNLDARVNALHSARDYEGFFTGRDLSKWELRYDLDNNREKYSWALNNLVEIGSIRTDLEIIPCSSNTLSVDAYYKFEDEYDNYIIVKIPKNSTNGSVISDSGIGFVPGNDGLRVTVREDDYISLEPEPLGEQGLTALLFTKQNTEKYYLDPQYEWRKGKGVIYYMKDEFGNELPYDFQNILFNYEGFDVPTFARLEITTPVDLSTASITYDEGYYDTKFTYTLVSTQQSKDLFVVSDECDVNIKCTGTSIFYINAVYYDGQRQITKSLFDSSNEYERNTTIPAHSLVQYSMTSYGTGANFEITIPNSTTVSVHEGATNNVIMPWVTEGIANLNRNLFVCSSNDNYVCDNFTDYNSHDNIVKCDAIDCKIGKYCEENELVDAECCSLGDDCVKIKSDHANGLHVGNKCHDITLDQSSGVVETIVDDMVYNITSALTETYNHIRNEWEEDGREPLTNEEMDIVLGGELPVYLMDQNGDMVLDDNGDLIEII